MSVTLTFDLSTCTSPKVEKGKYIWMDGELVAWDEARVHVLTHTLHYGMGVFEGIRCYKGKDGRSAIVRLHEHAQRLWQSARILGLESPYGVDQIEQACIDSVRANEFEECYIRPLLFIGAGEMGLAATGNPLQLSVAVWPWGSYLGDDGLNNGIRVHTSSFQRYHVNTLMTKSKAVGHYINSILASMEARDGGYDEALMLDVDGYAAEGCGENLFIFRNGRIKTPPIATVLEGVTRDCAITLLESAGYQVVEERFTRDEVYIADEAFFTGTAAEITPIRSLDDRVIADGKPGKVTRQVQQDYFAAIRGESSEYSAWLTYV